MSILKLKPATKEYIWGGQNLKKLYHKEHEGDLLAETWELSCHPQGMCLIANGSYEGKTLQEYIDVHSEKVLGSNCSSFEKFPIIIKLIDAKDNLSIQVHPDNEFAEKNEKEYGKTEMWYVADCKEGASIYYGFKEEIKQDELKKRVEDNTITEVLNKVYVQKGDVFFIEPGILHAIGKDIIIAEIQQNSNATYRLYDYGRMDKDGKPRELQIEKAMAVTSKKPVQKMKKDSPHLIKCDYFTVDKIYLDDISYHKLSGSVTDASFMSILILEGEGNISTDQEKVSFQKGDSFFLPAGSGNFEIEGICEALVTRV